MTVSSATSTVQHGRLAQQWCDKLLPLQVLKTNAFYIGTYDPETGPCSRESVEYFKTNAEAELALQTNSWTQRLDP